MVYFMENPTKMGWFGNTIIFGNTQMYNLILVVNVTGGASQHVFICSHSQKTSCQRPSECLWFPCMMPPQAGTAPLPAKRHHHLGFSTSEMRYELEEWRMTCAAHCVDSNLLVSAFSKLLCQEHTFTGQTLGMCWDVLGCAGYSWHHLSKT